ncbi:sigma-70 family RNA polymerase sigma factor [Streptomyces palmae]|uniref:Sigma-70 family RNA polymerase sigma factor n=1 Tax=Streptomyces palmae TaxID=1701085 RepID=A0A4Z0G962_9ACTN|nr:sigma-70 family RNA polymerase sigma factor [Streptomyces palmae]TGA91169.1 sigma-70 family RNA polymerase sigma factor [Streptomyces palmae]
MNQQVLPAERFEADRAHLRAVAYRILGSLSEAEDAVQEAWLRVSRADAAEVENITGWLTTVVSRVCLNMLRTRQTRREELLEEQPAEPVADPAGGADPEEEALLADSVGVALLVVLDTLSPAERIAFVLHDMFAVPFEDIALMLERSPAATRQLASRARRRVRGGSPAAGTDPNRRRGVVDAFLAATRGGDFEALLSLLHPDVVLRADALVVPTPEPITVRGAELVARGAMAATGRAGFTGVALLDGSVGLVMAPRGRLRLVLAFTITDAGITEIDVIADPERLAGIELNVLGE